MKKFFIVFGLLFGFIGDSFAVCELTESTDRTPSNEDLYPKDPNGKDDDSRMALICEKGKCEDGEIVFANAGHYWKETKINEARFYKCKLAVDDRWEFLDYSKIPQCPDDLGNRIFISGGPSGKTVGTEEAGNLFTNVCYKPWDERCGVKCDPGNNDKDFYCDNGVINCFEGTFSEYASFFRSCEYVDPKTRTDSYIIENEWFEKMSFWGEYILDYGEVVYGDMSICQGCASGLFYGGDGYCYSNLDEAWCAWRKNKDGKNVEWVDENHCECKDTGMEWNTEQHDCVKKTGSGKTGGGKTGGGKTGGKTGSSGGKTGSGSGKTGGKTGNKTGTNTGKVNQTCVEMYPGNAEAIACCEFGKNGGGAEWKDNKCNCVGENKKWDYSDKIKTGHCVDDKKPEKQPEKKPEIKDNKIDCVIDINASVSCRNGSKFAKNATVSTVAERCSLYKSNVAKYLNEIAGLLCADAGGVDNVLTDAQVKNAVDNMERFFEYTKSNANVWKNADGKFNIARLVSDATAGVILGTVGGIVSANIIKKRQVEKGFEALNCSVGGQKVADWGDEFTVGFRK